MAVDEKELKKAAQEVEAATADTAPTGEEVLKSLQDIVSDLKKAGFGDTASAHNGNAADKSSPSGGGGAPDGYDSEDEEEDADGSEGRVKRSVARSRAKSPGDVPGMGKSAAKKAEGEDTLEKSEADEEESEDDALTEQSVYKSIAKGEGAKADDYRQVVDASDAIQYLTDELVKGIAHVSQQVASAEKRHKKDIAAIRKSFDAERTATAALVKGMAHLIREQEVLAKSEAKGTAPKTTGQVVVVAADAKTAAGAGDVTKTSLLKSLSLALNKGTIDPAAAGNIAANLDVVPDVKKYWENLPQSFRDALTPTNAT
jgi:hypothetical protein